jgi:hypothetical protein
MATVIHNGPTALQKRIFRECPCTEADVSIKHLIFTNEVKTAGTRRNRKSSPAVSSAHRAAQFWITFDSSYALEPL